MTGGMIDDLLDHVEVNEVFLPPSVAESLSQSQASLERLKKLGAVSYAGGMKC